MVQFNVKKSYLDLHKAHKKILVNVNDDLTNYVYIVFNSKKGCPYFYNLLNININKTKLVEKYNEMLDGSWQKEGVDIFFLKDNFIAPIDIILHLKHFNRLKQFMIKLIKNYLFFRNVKEHWNEHCSNFLVLYLNNSQSSVAVGRAI